MNYLSKKKKEREREISNELTFRNKRAAQEQSNLHASEMTLGRLSLLQQRALLILTASFAVAAALHAVLSTNPAESPTRN